MPVDKLTLWDTELFEASAYSFADGDVVVLENSAELSNVAYNSCKVTLKWYELSPSNTLMSAFLGADVQFKDETNVWRPLPASQANPIRKSTQAPERIIIMQPNIVTLDGTIDDSRQPVGVEETRITYVNGKIPVGASIRVRLLMRELDQNGANAFVSVKVDGQLEVYDA